MTHTRTREPIPAPAGVRVARPGTSDRLPQLRHRPGSAGDVLDLQRTAGNHAVAGLIAPVQRVGGWADADPAVGSGMAATDPQTGWNVGEHAVGTTRRIPIDGLTGGIQSEPGESKSAKTLTDEKVFGDVKGAPRSTPEEQKGRGRAIALVNQNIDPKAPVQVLVHFHGNTEFAARGFAGWRQHEKSAEVRDVARDEIDQQIDAAKNPQLIGLLPQGVNSSSFGSINLDAYVADAFDRLTELGAWTAAPPSFSVVLSAHSGGGFTTENILSGKPSAHIDTVVLFEALHVTRKGHDQVAVLENWIEAMVGGHADFLNDPAKDAQAKQDRLGQLTKVRLVWDPDDDAYNSNYVRLEKALARWFRANKARLGANAALLQGLVTFERIKGVGHEGLVRNGLKGALPGPAPAKAAVP